MQLRAPAIFIAARPHGETAIIARLFTQAEGVVAAYVAGGRGRQLRPVAIPGNIVEADIRAKSDSQLPFARLELMESRGPWLTEPLPAATFGWVCALTASVLPERQGYPELYSALSGLLDAVCHAPSARGWIGALVTYETLMLREMGFGGARPQPADFADALAYLDRLEEPIARHLLAGRAGDVMAARALLRARLGRIEP